ncbi:hypothetical protein GGI00_005081, partial [Coemansia sp. RSA 2681]
VDAVHIARLLRLRGHGADRVWRATIALPGQQRSVHGQRRRCHQAVQAGPVHRRPVRADRRRNGCSLQPVCVHVPAVEGQAQVPVDL